MVGLANLSLFFRLEMESQKVLLNSIVKNQLDRVKLLSNLKKYKVNFDQESPHVLLKYKLKLALLENLSNSATTDIEADNFARLKKETEDFLKFHNEKLSRVKYKCTLVGCLYDCNKHRDYLRHLQRVHPEESKLGCQYGLTCKSAFSSLISNAHQSI